MQQTFMEKDFQILKMLQFAKDVFLHLMYQKSDLSDSESDGEFSQTTIKSETEEELILSKNESEAELGDNIPSTSSNKTSFRNEIQR